MKHLGCVVSSFSDTSSGSVFMYLCLAFACVFIQCGIYLLIAMWVPVESILEALPEFFWEQGGNGHLFQRNRETKSNVGGKQESKDYWGTGNIRKQFSIVFFLGGEGG